MKKTILILSLFVILISLLFSGCANQILYGTWQLSETLDAETFEVVDSMTGMFANMMVFTINKDGTVEFLGDVYGTYTKSRNEFQFVYTTKDGAEKPNLTGAWEMNAGNLYIYPDDVAMIYHLIRVDQTQD